MADSVVFSARGLTKDYPLGDTVVHALRGIDLELRRGEFVVMLGPSGSGKSTLLNILGGLDNPTSGEVWFEDHNLVQASADELTRFRRQHVGFVFQFYNLIPNLTAEENVALAVAVAEHPMTPAEALARVGLAERGRHFPSQLSGGEQQRVAIARAVAKRPNLLLCDEPTGALDQGTGKQVLQALLDVNQELGTLVVIITHNAAIADIAHRVLRMADGRLVSVQCNPQRRPLAEITW